MGRWGEWSHLSPVANQEIINEVAIVYAVWQVAGALVDYHKVQRPLA
jgi:hypothetical protein